LNFRNTLPAQEKQRFEQSSKMNIYKNTLVLAKTITQYYKGVSSTVPIQMVEEVCDKQEARDFIIKMKKKQL